MLAPQIVDRYAIHEKIASGGMAAVHFGRSVGAAGFARTVAVKRLHAHLLEQPGFSATLIDEARLAARIHHPNVVPVLDVVSSGGELLVVMEYVRGESLAQLLQAEHAHGGRMAPPVASAIAMGALHGLHAAHEATSERGTPLHIVHRDVSPQNILVDVDGVARVIDFGIAKAADRLQTTTDGSIKGKRAYMAPEQIVGGEVTPRTDVYSMAVVLWEMLTCQRLFVGDSNVARAVLGGATSPPSDYAPDVTPELDAIVMKGLSLDAASRFSSAREMAEALQRAVAPAFATEVGEWVRETARENLGKRTALLAAIEGGAASPPGAELLLDEAPTVALQPSSLSVETRQDHPSAVPRPRWVRSAVAAAGATGVLVAGIVMLVGRHGPPEPSTRPFPAPMPAPALPSSPPIAAAAEPIGPEGGTPDQEEPAPSQTVPSSRPRPSASPPHHAPPRRPPAPAPASTHFDPASVR